MLINNHLNIFCTRGERVAWVLLIRVWNYGYSPCLNGYELGMLQAGGDMDQLVGYTDSTQQKAVHCESLQGLSKDNCENGLLLQAFEMFTQASNSLESAFGQLQLRVQRLTEELEQKNKELERSLREKEEAQRYLRTILERLPCGVLALDSLGNISLCNPMAMEVIREAQGVLESKRDGRQVAIGAEILEQLLDSVATGGENPEVEISIGNDHKKRIIATSGTILGDVNGKGAGSLHILRDVTEFKELQEQNKRVERLSAMGEMAVELAHEIRNPLASIELFASLLTKDLSDDSRRWAENIRIGIRTMNTIVSNMLHFANPISPAFSKVDLHDLIREVMGFVEPIMNQRDVHATTSLEAEDPLIMADAELVKQLMLNLIFNAMKAMPSRGSLVISTSSVDIHGGDKPSRGLELRIQDTGIGIPPENMGRIFDPFFTTSRKGTGLGLWVVNQIVEKHGGCIKVRSEMNRGTTFTIVLKNAPAGG